MAGSFTSSYPNPDDATDRVDDVPLPFRVQVTLVRVDGTWLVDGFTPVTGDEPEDPAADPSADPSTGVVESPGDPSASPTEGASP